MELQELIAISNPPSILLTIFQFVQLLLTGFYADIDVNPSNNKAKSDDWRSCLKMACKNSHQFLEACIDLF